MADETPAPDKSTGSKVEVSIAEGDRVKLTNEHNGTFKVEVIANHILQSTLVLKENDTLVVNGTGKGEIELPEVIQFSPRIEMNAPKVRVEDNSFMLTKESKERPQVPVKVNGLTHVTTKKDKGGKVEFTTPDDTVTVDPETSMVKVKFNQIEPKLNKKGDPILIEHSDLHELKVTPRTVRMEKGAPGIDFIDPDMNRIASVDATKSSDDIKEDFKKTSNNLIKGIETALTPSQQYKNDDMEVAKLRINIDHHNPKDQAGIQALKAKLVVLMKRNKDERTQFIKDRDKLGLFRIKDKIMPADPDMPEFKGKKKSTSLDEHTDNADAVAQLDDGEFTGAPTTGLPLRLVAQKTGPMGSKKNEDGRA